VLAEDDYQLQMVEAPQVDSSELRAAVRWRVKDLIDFHIDDAVFDAFALPGRAGTAEQERAMMYVAAARARRVGELVRQVHDTDLELEIIDIPELAIRNLARLEEADAKGVVVLKIGDASGLVTLTRQGELYISRHLELGAADLRDAESGRFDDVLLEVQRSMDYYTSHFSQPSPAALRILPTFEAARRLADWMDDQLDMDVDVFEPARMLQTDDPDETGFTTGELLALGGALRCEEVRL
jgi:MSHA biogenesis protein MshI